MSRRVEGTFFSGGVEKILTPKFFKGLASRLEF